MIESSDPYESPDQAHRPANEPEEQAHRQVEIAHNPHSDIILNNEARLALWGPKLADICRDGIPDDWESINSASEHVRVGIVNGKRFVARDRTKTLNADELKELRALPPEELAEAYSFTKAELYAFNSILSEIRLAPAINDVLASDEVQKFIREYGFSGISYVEPIMGVIARGDNGSATKSVVYEYIDGAGSLNAAWNQLNVAGGTNYDLTYELSKLMRRGGINAADLTTKQLLIDEDLHLYLLDAEAYTQA